MRKDESRLVSLASCFPGNYFPIDLPWDTKDLLGFPDDGICRPQKTWPKREGSLLAFSCPPLSLAGWLQKCPAVLQTFAGGPNSAQRDAVASAWGGGSGTVPRSLA